MLGSAAERFVSEETREEKERGGGEKAEEEV